MNATVFQNQALGALLLIVAIASPSAAQSARLPAGQKWVASWAASVHGPYPSGNPSAQPDLRFAFPDPAQGAVDQSFRLIVRPDLWGDRVRIRSEERRVGKECRARKAPYHDR